MVKYRLQYTDVIGTEYECNIYDDNYTDEPILIGGYCVLDYPKIDNIYQVIRGSGMRVTLEASASLTLEDLYENGEKQNPVTLSREGVVIFRGFIDPAGLFEDLVNDEWEVTLDCVDGLALLEDLSYVNDNGAPFTGVLSDLEVINNCLKRTGVTLEDGTQPELITSINTRYEPRNLNLDPINVVHSNQERFYKDDGETIMSCKEVLESTLRKYGGCIMQTNGKWSIFSFYELLSNDRLFTTYKNGVFVSSEITNYEYQDIVTFNGTNTDDVHWVNGNQRKEITPPVGAVRVNYKYGFVNSLVKNPTFENDGTSIDQWTILEPTGLTLENERYISITSDVTQSSMVQSNTFDVSENERLKISVTYNLGEGINSQVPKTKCFFRFGVVLENQNNTYWLGSSGNWGTSSNFYENLNVLIVGDTGSADFTIDVEPSIVPETGVIRFVILRPETRSISINSSSSDTGTSYPGIVNVITAKITAVQDASVQGETHTQQIEGRNTRVEEVIEVGVGDTPSDIYNGALYKEDGITNTDFWGTTNMALDFVNNQSILEILSEKIAIYKKNPTYYVSGDVFGYFNPLKLLNLDLVNNRVFIVASYSLNTKTNVNSCEFMEVKNDTTFGITYEYALDYGNVQKPTIIG